MFNIGIKYPFFNNKSIREYTIKSTNDYIKRIIEKNEKNEKNKNNIKFNFNNIDSFKEFDEYNKYNENEKQNKIILNYNSNPNNFNHYIPFFVFFSISTFFLLYSNKK